MKILLAGETFSVTQSVAIGREVLTSASWRNGATAFIKALTDQGIAVEQIGGEHCSEAFPRTLDELKNYSVIVISDVSALTLLLTPETLSGHVSINRLSLLKNYVADGGGLMLAGGYMGFQGMFGTAGFGNTAVEDVLPVRCLPHVDGLEVPEGLEIAVEQPSHPILAGLAGPFPAILGLNKLIYRGDASCDLVASCRYRENDWPLLATRTFGRGRTLAWATDIAPHWLPVSFLEWPSYPTLMLNMMHWLATATR